MDRVKIWPHMTIVAVAIALITGVGVALYLRHQQTVRAEALPPAARIQSVDGEVAFSDSLLETEEEAEWVAATPNQPFSVGNRIYTRDNSRASLAFSGRNFARLDPNTSLDMVYLGDRRTQLGLRDGSAIFDIGHLARNEVFEVATPYGAVGFQEPGLYNIGFDNNGNVLVSVLSGLAQVVGLGGSGQISKGEMLTLLGQTVAEVALSRLNSQDAGYLVDDYYQYQYPDFYDGRYLNYDVYLNDPYYYDPYRNFASYQYASAVIPGLNDLDYYGDWHNVDGHGYAWRPQVDPGWAPYQQGYWMNHSPYGLTWVSTEPWGYAPYHYGRWANVSNQWYWIPDRVNTTPTYAPALVAFIPLNEANQIGWVPLGPGDPYVPRYYDDNWQPQYLTRSNVVPAQLVNLAIPGAVTVVPLDAFGRVIDSRRIIRVEPHVFASVRPTLEPLMVTPLRNAVLHSAWGRGKIDLPPGIAKKLRETPVLVAADAGASPFRNNVERSMRIERVSDKARKQKFSINEQRKRLQQADSERQQDRSDQRQLEQQQRDQERAERKAAQPQGERAQPPAAKPGRGQAPQGKPEVRQQQPRDQQNRIQPNRGQGQGGEQGQAAGKGKGRGKP